jgi:hypothetical protein
LLSSIKSPSSGAKSKEETEIRFPKGRFESGCWDLQIGNGRLKRLRVHCYAKVTATADDILLSLSL